MSTSAKLPPLPAAFIANVVRSDGLWYRIYHGGLNRVRIDNYQGEVCRSISITLGDLGRGYTFIPATKTYSIAHFPPILNTQQFDPTEDYSWAEIGQETVNGVLCTKFAGRLTQPDRVANWVFVDPKTGIRLKTQTFNKLGDPVLSIEFRQVEVGPPPADVFEPLEGYRLTP
ncbi:hypothetical protein ETAA8_01740 [Anatilimnocola aggregata]|uniref:MucB/RseB N-terminal domain-containing protein n=1 Tax=Anatilimnocola aggregata TaxID=2528021 RepID=A0A517Y4D9_9BACT|nr:hypothetical protein [Anatilimnocola aggregata]QDU25113.1 hypothetical protein ETAA8_01740 [Anatilimnocola aggregata]